jgi:hypothetical protein
VSSFDAKNSLLGCFFAYDETQENWKRKIMLVFAHIKNVTLSYA